MKIELSKEKFENIDVAFDKLLENRSDSASIKSIERSLKSIFPDKKISVAVVENKIKSNFFIMSVYPDQKTIDTVIKAIVDNKDNDYIREIWNGSDTWHIEIDSKILDNSIVRVTSKELTALLLHELGHIVYSNSIPQRISRVMKLEFARAGVNVKAAMKHDVFSQVLEIPILLACQFDNYKTSNNIKKELKADVFVVKMGYIDELDRILTKIIASSDYKKNLDINKNANDMYSDMKTATLFSLQTISDLKDRKSAIVRKKFSDMVLASPSVVVNKSIDKLTTSLVKGNINESFESNVALSRYNELKMIEESAITAFLKNRNMLKKIESSDIGYIDIKRSEIRDDTDKSIVLAYAYNKLDTVNYYMAIIDSNNTKFIVPHSKEELIKMQNIILGLIEDINKTRTVDMKTYGLDIRYPVGYEG